VDRFTTRQLIWLEAARRELDRVGSVDALSAAASRAGSRPRTVGLSWEDFRTWLEEAPAGLPSDVAAARAAGLREVVAALVRAWGGIAEPDDAARRAALARLSFLDRRRAFLDIQEGEEELSDWVGVCELFPELASDELYPRARALLAAYLELHPALQL
jgi:hypothetical protein